MLCKTNGITLARNVIQRFLNICPILLAFKLTKMRYLFLVDMMIMKIVQILHSLFKLKKKRIQLKVLLSQKKKIMSIQFKK